jgi:hypothetical protein
LDIPELSATAAVAHVFPDMANNSLLSVAQLCNEGYSVTFTIGSVTLFNNIGKEILKGNRDLDTGLWRINLRKEIQHKTIASANNVYELQGHIATWPGLIEDAINNHLKLTPAMVMRHMNKKRQNIRSKSKTVTITSDLEDTTSTPAGTGDKTNFV